MKKCLLFLIAALCVGGVAFAAEPKTDTEKNASAPARPQDLQPVKIVKRMCELCIASDWKKIDDLKPWLDADSQRKAEAVQSFYRAYERKDYDFIMDGIYRERVKVLGEDRFNRAQFDAEVARSGGKEQMARNQEKSIRSGTVDRAKELMAKKIGQKIESVFAQVYFDGEEDGIFTQYFLRRDGRWILVSHQTFLLEKRKQQGNAVRPEDSETLSH